MARACWTNKGPPESPWHESSPPSRSPMAQIFESARTPADAPPRHGGSRAGTAVAAVVERGHGDGAGAADRLRQEARERDGSIVSAVKVGQVEGEGGGCQRGDGLFARA
eukprot:scaffold67852_cov60-Phaeocystis_antarctica.AAC.1